MGWAAFWLVLQRPLDPPRQPYPWRYAVITQDGLVPLTAQQPVRAVQASGEICADHAQRRSLLEALVPYLALLETGRPHPDAMVLEDLDGIPRLSEEHRAGLALPDGYGYREAESADGLLVTAYLWSPVGAHSASVTDRGVGVSPVVGRTRDSAGVRPCSLSRRCVAPTRLWSRS